MNITTRPHLLQRFAEWRTRRKKHETWQILDAIRIYQQGQLFSLAMSCLCCQALNAKDARYCSHCGSRLQIDTEDVPTLVLHEEKPIVAQNTGPIRLALPPGYRAGQLMMAGRQYLKEKQRGVFAPQEAPALPPGVRRPTRRLVPLE